MYRNTPSKTIRRVTVNLPGHLLHRACSQTGRNITETLVEGLELVQRRGAYEKLMALKGKIDIDIDIDEARGRGRR